MKHIIIVGNVVDGLSFIGPFDSNDKALDYARGLVNEWDVAEMEEPEVEEPEPKPPKVPVWPWPAEGL